MARMQGKTFPDGYECFAGVDVSKAHLDLAVADRREVRRFANDAAGIAQLLACLGGRSLVVFEPTGRYHLALWRALGAAGHGVAPVNPFAARRLAEGLGQLAKTDAIDAATLCEIARRFPPRLRPAPDDITLEILELYAARRAAIRRRASLRTQARGSGNAMVLRLLAEEETLLGTQIEALTEALMALFAARPATRRALAILTSIPGIGEGAAITLLAGMPELGTLSPAEAAALSGTAPMTRQSGQWTGRSRTCGGRRALRAALHMPAIAAMTHNPDLRAFAQRLRAKGKHGVAIITAVLRKLILLANTLIAKNRTWKPITT